MSSDLSDAGSGVVIQESYREIKCCFSVTIRRDAWGVPVAIMGQWIVGLPQSYLNLADVSANMIGLCRQGHTNGWTVVWRMSYFAYLAMLCIMY